MKTSLRKLTAVLVFSLALPSVSMAQHQHGGPVSTGEPMQMDTREVLVHGVRVVFQIMSNKEHVKMLADMKMNEKPEAGTTHNITVVLLDDQTGKEITDALVRMKVIDPKGRDQIKTLKAEKEMKSYDAYFDLTEKGKYQVLITFKAADKTMNAGIYHDVH